MKKSKNNNRELQIKTLTDDILGKSVVDNKGIKIGKVYDLAISKGKFPYVEGIIVGHNNLSLIHVIKFRKGLHLLPNKKYVDWQYIKKIENNKFILKFKKENVNFVDIPTDKRFIVKRILDEQLVDKKNQFVGRVDDVELIYSKYDNTLTVAGFYSGVSGIIMHIGTKKYASSMQKLFGNDVENDLIPWNTIKKVCIKPRKIVLNFVVKKYENIYAKLIEQVSKQFVITNDDAEKIINSIKPEIMEKRFGLESVYIPVVRRFEIFVNAIETKKIRFQYLKLLKSIEQREEKYNMLVVRNKKFREIIEKLFYDLVEHFKSNKKFDGRKIKNRVDFARKMLVCK